MNNEYLIPANANRGKLIFGYFRGIDLIIFAVGLLISFILLVAFQDAASDTLVTVLLMLPGIICILLVMPIPYQHNVLVLLQAIYSFYFVNRQQYVWKGWCGSYGDSKK